MRLKISARLWRLLAFGLAVIAVGIGGYYSRNSWFPLLIRDAPDEVAVNEGSSFEEPKVVKLSPQARTNLGLISNPVGPQTYWRKIQIPGVIIDRPGITDRAITSPIAGVITQVHAFEGDIIQPGEKLFSLRLVSEYLQKTQSELFKGIRETEILNQELARLTEIADRGIIPEKRILELQQQISRQAALIEASRQDLRSRGLRREQIARIESGEFLTTIEIFAPTEAETGPAFSPVGLTGDTDGIQVGFFEIQTLGVELGEQVDAGQALAVLANHTSLFIKGHAFKKEASHLARATENEWPVEVEFAEDAADDWPALSQTYRIRHLANTTDPSSRTFDFFIPLTNQSRVYNKDDETFILWRFRPGQRVRIDVPIELIHDVLVLPASALIREGPEAYVFHQNGDLFNRISVRVVHQDRSNVAIANDGSIAPGFYLAQNAAASLNRILKAQAASGMRADVHVHADGTVHSNH